MATLTPLEANGDKTTDAGVVRYAWLSSNPDWAKSTGVQPASWTALEPGPPTGTEQGQSAIGLEQGSNSTIPVEFYLTNTNADFGFMDTLSFVYSSAEIQAPDQYVDDTGLLRVIVYASNGTTVLAGFSSSLQQVLDHFDGTDWTDDLGLGGSATAPAYTKTVAFDYFNATALKADWDGAYIEFEFADTRAMGSDAGAVLLIGFKMTGTYTPVEEKTDVPSRHNSSTAKTVTAALAQDQWGKYVVPQVPWVNPVKRSYGMVVDGTGYGCDFSPDGRFLAVSHFTSPYISVFDRSGSTFTKVSALTAPEGNSNDCAFSPDGRFLAVAHDTSPYITVYEHDGDGTFTKVTALTAPDGVGNGCAWSPDGRFLAVAHTTTPFITVYERTGTTGTTFTKVTALSALESTGYGCDFSPDGRFLAVAHWTSPFITVYERSGTTFTKVTALTAPESTGRDCAFSPDGRFLAVSHSTSPYITVYERSGSTFTKVTALTAPESTGWGCKFSPDGRFLAVSHDTTPFITVYQRSGTSFTKVSALTALGGSAYSCDWSPDGRFLAVGHGVTPYIYVYETSGLNPREGYLWMLDPGER